MNVTDQNSTLMDLSFQGGRQIISMKKVIHGGDVDRGMERGWKARHSHCGRQGVSPALSEEPDGGMEGQYVLGILKNIDKGIAGFTVGYRVSFARI